ncbi:uncharacterized protein CLUP02_00385 [Colletotrichum lupini]|uniref:Uncharacterized protein n=1 Tax=Colletotrichum lupini TaxID=145971 RepID=A0A9Q8SAN2_9PEZI|nr:uncharacterized protein CLUP02_00385 [Colletotrichum lupini]UQC73739.1 hypothetical protein CLUP02_00385 [Colletotrichum lupini]
MGVPLCAGPWAGLSLRSCTTGKPRDFPYLSMFLAVAALSSGGLYTNSLLPEAPDLQRLSTEKPDEVGRMDTEYLGGQTVAASTSKSTCHRFGVKVSPRLGLRLKCKPRFEHLDEWLTTKLKPNKYECQDMILTEHSRS